MNIDNIFISFKLQCLSKLRQIFVSVLSPDLDGILNPSNCIHNQFRLNDFVLWINRHHFEYKSILLLRLRVSECFYNCKTIIEGLTISLIMIYNLNV